MANKVLITGGAGFIGLNLSRALLGQGYDITILDNFSGQVHDGKNTLPLDLARHVKLITGDVRDKNLMRRAIRGQNSIVHFAAETGTGQSMYQIDHYSGVNIGGTAVLCDLLVNCRNNVGKMVVASSRAVYGEGKYRCRRCGVVYPHGRTHKSVKSHGYSPICPKCGSSKNMTALKTDEHSEKHPASIYGLTKQVQEQMVILTASVIGLDAYALRYQNVYGPGQSLSNPYTGILSIFSRLAISNAPIRIFEDGLESRDFVYVDDVVSATAKCLRRGGRGQHILNVGSGKWVPVIDVAKAIKRYFNSKSVIDINGAFREGDIRHNCADLKEVQSLLGYSPEWGFSEGLKEFLNWAYSQGLVGDSAKYQKSLDEMKKKGLYH